MIDTMDVRRALSDLAEVRERLARLQRFEGYSAPAAAASGVAALIAGLVQSRLVPLPHAGGDLRLYAVIWMSCLAAGLALNYGTVAAWLLRHRSSVARSQFRSAALSILPSIVLGGALSLALADHGQYALLPGAWFAFYAIGLFASREVIPPGAVSVTIGFAVLALLFLATPLQSVSLAWWVMPLGFGLGQLAIGALIWGERRA